jgi:hypothetical protein
MSGSEIDYSLSLWFPEFFFPLLSILYSVRKELSNHEVFEDEDFCQKFAAIDYLFLKMRNMFITEIRDCLSKEAKIILEERISKMECSLSQVTICFTMTYMYQKSTRLLSKWVSEFLVVCESEIFHKKIFVPEKPRKIFYLHGMKYMFGNVF